MEGCQKSASKRGWCPAHYQRWRKYGSTELNGSESVRAWSYRAAQCSIEGCSEPVASRSWCSSHYRHWQRYENPSEAIPRPRMTLTSCQFGCGFERDWRPSVVNHEKKCRLAPGWEPDRSMCGTPTGASRHRQYGEPLCDPCRTASNADSLARRHRRFEPKRVDLTCGTCGIQFTRSRSTKFCSDTCRRRDPEVMERQREFAMAHRARNPRPYEVTCELCGTQAMVSAPDGRFCSHDCSVLWRLEHPEHDARKRNRPWHCTDLVHLGPIEQYPDPRSIVQRPCRYCAAPFEAELQSQKHCCSDRCSSAFSKYGRSRQFDDGRWWRFFVAGPCSWCGESFVATASAPSHAPTYCTRQCQKAAGKARRGRFVIPDNVRQSIYERDRWICQLCGDPVDPTLGPSDPWGATLDHIVCQAWTDEPDHSPSNLRLAHRWCNSVRADESHPEALALFGN